jgi:hypothetical protein
LYHNTGQLEEACVCVCERERASECERERERERDGWMDGGRLNNT